MDKSSAIKFIFAGILLGCISFFIVKSTDYTESLFIIITQHWKYASLFLTPVGFLMIAWLIHRFFNGAQGSGIPQTIRALQLSSSEDCSHYLSIRILLGKLLIIPAYLCGGSLGYEGPAVQIGASIMMTLQKHINAPKESLYYILVLSGAAAGLSASLTAPLTGIMFVIEEFNRYFYKNYFMSYILFAVIISCYISDIAVGHYVFLTRSAIDDTPLKLNDLYGFLWIPLCGMLGGFMGSIFNHSLISLTKFLPRISSRHPLLLALMAGTLLGLLNFATNNQTAGCGAEISKNIFLGQSISPIYAPLKMIATLLTYIAGIPTGLFTPSLGIGAVLSQALLPILPSSIHPHIIIILMMAAYLCGVLQAPLTVCTLIMEITGQDSLLLPLIATTIISNYTAGTLLKVPLYESLAFLIPNSHPTYSSSEKIKKKEKIIHTNS